MTPIIGITTNLDEKSNPPRQTLNHNYVQAVEQAGGIPLILPITDSPSTLTPILNHLKACRQIRGHEATESIPIIIVTTRSEPANVDAGFASG